MQPRRGATIQCEARIGMQHEAVSTASSDSMVRAAIADSSTRPRTHKTASNELLRDVCFTSKSMVQHGRDVRFLPKADIMVPLFDHLVGATHDRNGNGNLKCLCRF